jgi:hypothetical protein
MTRGLSALLALVVVAVGCSSGLRRADPPALVPWHPCHRTTAIRCAASSSSASR